MASAEPVTRVPGTDVLERRLMQAVELGRDNRNPTRPWLFALRTHAALLFLVAMYAGAYFVAHSGARPVDPRVFLVTGGVLGLLMVLAVPLRVLVASARSVEASPDGGGDSGLASRTARWRDLARPLLTPRRLADAGVMWLATSLLLAVFLQWKAGIGVTAPFSWDARLEALDRLVHGGRAPWTLIHPVVAFPIVTVVIDFVYHSVWSLVFVGAIALVAWSEDLELRRRFLLVYAASWILIGTVGAYAFASAGPVYFGLVSGAATPFGPLLDYLAAVHGRFGLSAADIADELWAFHVTGYLPRVGISAMPSMHVAMATLMVLATWRSGRLVRATMLAFLAIVLVGSVHLAWHYAIDGYASMAVVALLWWVSGKWSGAPA